MQRDNLFNSEKFGFRSWIIKDLTAFAKINTDLEVMEYFPKPSTEEKTTAFITQLIDHYAKYNHN